MKRTGLFIILTILVIILSPIIFMALFSVSENRFIVFPVQEYSIKWYISVINNPVVLNSLGYTIIIGLIVSGLSVCLGFMSAYWLNNAKGINKQLFLALFTIPAIVPFILYGLGFLEFARNLGIARSGFAVVIAHTVTFSPLATVYLFHQISRLNEDIEFSARELGAPNYRVIIEIVGGQIAKNIFVCAIVIFALSWDEYIISWFVSGFQKTYAVQVRNMLESTFSPEVFALGSLIGFFILLLVSIAFGFSRKELTLR